MRLICGIWHLDGRPASEQMLALMCEAQQSIVRPALTKYYLEGSVGMAVMDFSPHAVPPFLQEIQDRTAADVRLDQPEESARVYGLPSNASEEAIVAKALAKENPGQVINLYGEFALAHWNPQERRLRLCRDAMGVRPLVFNYQVGRHVVFASMPAALFASGLVAKELDDEQLGLEVLRVYSPGGTLFCGVKAVKPGYVIDVTPDRIKETCYWEPKLRPPLAMKPKDAGSHLRHLLTETVESALGDAGPVGTHLSGGLDSSGLAVLAGRTLRAQGRSLFGYSFLGDCWPGLTVDGEAPFVRAVLQQEPDIQWKAVTHTLPEEWLTDRVNPNAAVSLSSTAPDNAICADASANGIDRILSGWGGDEGVTFNGRGALPGAFRNLRWLYLARELRALNRARGFDIRKMFLGEVVQPLLPEFIVQRARRLLGRRETTRRIEPEFLTEKMRTLLTGKSLIATLPDARATQLRLLRSAHIAHRATYFATLGARYGIAFSFPMLNRRVVEFALSMHPNWHIQGGWKRSVYRDAMKGILPEMIRERHTKLAPLPGANYEYARMRHQLANRLRELEGVPAVSSRFNIQRFLQITQALPSPDKVQNPTAEPAFALVPAMAHTLALVFFVEQHFG